MAERKKRDEGAYASEQRLHLFLSISWKERKGKEKGGERQREGALGLCLIFSFVAFFSM